MPLTLPRTTLLLDKYVWPDRWRSPLFVRGVAQEERYPWRTGPCVIVRLPLIRTALGIGRWTGKAPQGEDEMGPYLDMRRIDWNGVWDVPAGREEAG